ncbi:MAG: hypothetical protein PHY93_04510 [Bacteriovorax sp.]|nr:hypothetical protein [Bacteriovorax sp.]
MRIFLIFIYSVFISHRLLAQSEETLSDSVKSFQVLQKELDETMRLKTPDCLSGTGLDPIKSYCSVKDYCSMNEIHTDDPILYQNEKGEKVVNDGYYHLREDIRSCLKEKYADEIISKRDELTHKLGTLHLQKIIAANKKLNQLADKYNQGAKIQKISAEILNISLEIGISNSVSDWDKDRPSNIDLRSFLSLAEKRTKITLNPEIKKTLIEIQYLKKNPLYADEVDVVENTLIPEVKSQDPFFDWTLLTDEKAAGGKKALEQNRTRLIKKTQDAYNIFQETRQEILGYLESKKNEMNVEKIERIIERVKTIRFNPPRLTKTVENECKYPNAFYSPDDHSFTICPQMLDYPKIALMEVMAHEISHSYDSCTFSGKIFKNTGPSTVEEAPFDIIIKMDPVLGNYRNSLTLNLKPKNKNQDIALYADNPFSKTLSCLQDPKSVGAQSIKPEEIKRKTQEQLAELTRIGQNTPNNTKAKYLNFLNDHQKEYFDYFQGCDFSNNGDTVARSQMQEAFADKMASEIVARKLKTLSKVEAEKSVLEIALSLGNICENDKAGATKLREFAIKEKCPDFYENLTTEMKVLKAMNIADPKFNSHPVSAIRIDRNLLAHPEIRKALKCPLDSGVKYCE